MRRPSFTLAAVLTLAVGIGATTAIFSVVYSVLIKPLPYPNADELVSVSHAAPGANITGDLGEDRPMYLTYRDENRTFASIGLWQQGDVTLADRDEPERVSALVVTDGILQALGVQPMRGRWFTPEETLGPEAEGYSVILSYAFWQRRFGGDEAAVGRELSIESRPSQVVGIMPRDFRFLDITPQPDVIVAVPFDPAQLTIGGFSWETLARLMPGVTPAEARADVERMLPIWLDAWPTGPGLTKETLASWRITPIVRPLLDELVGGIANTLWVLMGAIGAVLLIACANIANLLLVRSDARRQELAVRVALGAGSARIARELLVESLVLGAAGCALGLALAYVGVQILVAIGPSNLPRLQDVGVHPPVLAFTVAVSLASTLLFGSIPALKAALRVERPLSGLPRGSSVTRERSATRSVLVVVQVALALVLVVSAALMIRSFQALRDVDPGFSDPETIQTARIWIPTAQFPDAEQYTRIQREMLDRIAALPGVASASFAHDLPMEGLHSNVPTIVEGDDARGWRDSGSAQIGLRLARLLRNHRHAHDRGPRRGVERCRDRRARRRDFRGSFPRDRGGACDALRRRVRFASDPAAWREVIGVAQSVRQDRVYDAPRIAVYWPVLRHEHVRNAIRRVRHAQRARGHRESRRRSPAGHPVGERQYPRSLSRARCSISTRSRSPARRSRS